MDRALPEPEQAQIREVLRTRESASVQIYDVRTRQAGQQAFVTVRARVPGDWTIRHGHDLVEQIAADLGQELPHAVVSTHLEPLQEPVAQHSGGQ